MLNKFTYIFVQYKIHTESLYFDLLKENCSYFQIFIYFYQPVSVSDCSTRLIET